MKQPLRISFLGTDPSDAVESVVRAKAEKLEQFCSDLMSCKVTIEQAHKHQHQGRLFAVRIEVTVPHHELTVDRVQNEDVYVALRDAFDDMRRQVEETVRRRRGQEKLHVIPLRGKVVRFSDERQHGFIQTADGEEFYFGTENVAGVPFEHLQVGTEVQFIPDVAAEGRQAKRVSVGKHHAG